MRKVVLDTNIIVSSFMPSGGNPLQIVNLFYSGKIQIFYSRDVLAEYKRVLAYERLNIPNAKQTEIIDAIKQAGTMIEPIASTFPMTDTSDRPFYDTAKAAGAILITGNMKDYPAEPFIMNPADFIKQHKGC